MILIKDKLNNSDVIDYFEGIAKEILGRVNQNPQYEDTIKMLINEEQDSWSIENIIFDIVKSELNVLRESEKYHVHYYIQTITMKENIKKNTYITGYGLEDIKQEIRNLFMTINESLDFKNKFFPTLQSENISELTSKNQCFEFINRIFKNFDSINDTLSEIFDYKMISKDERITIIQNMNVFVCPYCNAHDIITAEDRSFTEADVDHYFPKNEFPLFSSSYGNFVPSCKPCNGSILKGSSIREIVNPRIEAFGDDAIFEIIFSGGSLIEFYYRKRKKRLSREERNLVAIDLNNNCEDSDKNYRIKNSLDLFKLSQRYNSPTIKNKIIGYINRFHKERSDLYQDMIKDLSITESDTFSYFFKHLSDHFDEDELQDSQLSADYVNFTYSKIKLDIIKTYHEMCKEEN